MPPLDATAARLGFLLRSSSQGPEPQTLQALHPHTSPQPDAACLTFSGRVWQCLAYSTYPIKAILIAATAHGHRKGQYHQFQKGVHFMPGRQALSYDSLNQELGEFYFPYQLQNEMNHPARGPEGFHLVGQQRVFQSGLVTKHQGGYSNHSHGSISLTHRRATPACSRHTAQDC